MVSDDLATILRLAETPPLGLIHEPLVGIRKHASNFSGDIQAMNLGDSFVLEYALATRPSLAKHAALIKASMARRRRDALNMAFANFRFACVCEIYDLLPRTEILAATVLRRFVAGLPHPVCSSVAKFLLAASSLRARIVSGTESKGRIPQLEADARARTSLQQ